MQSITTSCPLQLSDSSSKSHPADELTAEARFGNEGSVGDAENAFELRTFGRDRDSARFYDIADLSNSDAESSHGDEPIVAFRYGKEKSSFTPDQAEAVVRKLDRRLVLFLAVLYMLSFLDRSNIGNARIAGLTNDLELTSAQYEWILTAFYITYILFEWMTLLYRIIPPHIYISLCVASWGLVASLQSVANSFSFLVFLRALLGVAEAAFGPGVPFYLSFFFKREELALRTGLFISAAPLATSFASSLAWLIVEAGQKGPIATWRLLFLVEGFPSIVVAFFAWHLIPDSPATARFLSAQERRVARLRLRNEDSHFEKPGQRHRAIQWKEIGQTLLDPKCYLTALMFFSCNVAFSSLPPFLPTIIKEMNYSPAISQFLSAPPYIISFFTVLLTAWLSDQYAVRSPFIIFHAFLGSLGYFIIALAGYLRANSLFRYAGVYLASAGFFSAVTLIITWTINNQTSKERRGTGVVMLNVLGQFGPLVGTRIYPDSDKPYYIRGMTTCGAFMLLVGLLATGLRLILEQENMRKMAKPTWGDSRVEVDEADDVGDLEVLVSTAPGRSEHQCILNIL